MDLEEYVPKAIWGHYQEFDKFWPCCTSVNLTKNGFCRHPPHLLMLSQIYFQGSCFNPHLFLYNKGPMMLYFITIYRSRFSLFISMINQYKYHQFSCDVTYGATYVKTVKNQKRQNLYLTIKTIHRVCYERVFEWIVRHLIKGLG